VERGQDADAPPRRRRDTAGSVWLRRSAPPPRMTHGDSPCTPSPAARPSLVVQLRRPYLIRLTPADGNGTRDVAAVGAART